MTTTPHGQVPEALIDLIDEYAETRHRCGGIYNAKAEAARNAVIEDLREALGGVQALSAAPGVTSEQRRLIGVIADKIEDGTLFQSGIYPKKDLARFVRNMLDATPTAPAASLTPPAEQQAQPGAVYAELHEPDATTVGLGAVWNRHSMRDFADRTHALRMQAAPKAAPGESLTRDQIREVFMAHGFTVKEGHTDLKQYVYDAAYALLAMGAAPQQEAQEPVAWESTTPGYIKYITQARYEEFSPAVRRWYKPYRCSGCAERGAGFDACDIATAAAQGFRRGQAAAKQEE